mgnify:CR=1 FL=1
MPAWSYQSTIEFCFWIQNHFCFCQSYCSLNRNSSEYATSVLNSICLLCYLITWVLYNCWGAAEYITLTCCTKTIHSVHTLYLNKLYQHSVYNVSIHAACEVWMYETAVMLLNLKKYTHVYNSRLHYKALTMATSLVYHKGRLLLHINITQFVPLS